MYPEVNAAAIPKEAADRIPDHAPAPGHDLFLAHQCDQPLIGCGDELPESSFQKLSYSLWGPVRVLTALSLGMARQDY